MLLASALSRRATADHRAYIVPVMGRGRSALLAVACFLGVVAVAWATAGGPVRMPDLSFGGPEPQVPVASPSATSSPSASPSRAPHGKPKPAERADIDLSWIRYVVVGGLALLLLVWLVRTVPRRVLRIWRDLPDEDPDDPDDTGGPLSPEELAAAVAADRDAQLAAVQEGTPRNGVVAAWSRLEEIAAQTGLARKRWETSAEFTARMLARLPVDVDAALDLGTLYRRARFSSHELTEDDRDRARAALTVLHHDLRAVHR